MGKFSGYYVFWINIKRLTLQPLQLIGERLSKFILLSLTLYYLQYPQQKSVTDLRRLRNQGQATIQSACAPDILTNIDLQTARIQLISSMICDLTISGSLAYYFYSFRLGTKKFVFSRKFVKLPLISHFQDRRYFAAAHNSIREYGFASMVSHHDLPPLYGHLLNPSLV